MGGPHLRITRRNGYGAAVCSRGVLVHRPSRLGAAVTILAAELLRGDGVLTKRASEGCKAVYHFDGVLSHCFHCSLHPPAPLRTKVMARDSQQLTNLS
jgi:hypothetical protein